MIREERLKWFRMVFNTKKKLLNHRDGGDRLRVTIVARSKPSRPLGKNPSRRALAVQNRLVTIFKSQGKIQGEPSSVICRNYRV